MRITITNLQKRLTIHPEKIRKLVLKILKQEKAKGAGWINLCFVDDPLIRKFNAKFHKTCGSTDVLAFDLSDKNKLILADIMISADTAIKASKEFKTTADYELYLYVCHGILHILGYDDHNPKQKKLMRKKESEYVDR